MDIKTLTNNNGENTSSSNKQHFHAAAATPRKHHTLPTPPLALPACQSVHYTGLCNNAMVHTQLFSGTIHVVVRL